MTPTLSDDAEYEPGSRNPGIGCQKLRWRLEKISASVRGHRTALSELLSAMRKYNFTGHLNPLPPGITCGLQLSGDVYLPSEVDAEISQMQQRHRDEVTRLHRQITKLRGQLDNQRRKRAAKT